MDKDFIKDAKAKATKTEPQDDALEDDLLEQNPSTESEKKPSSRRKKKVEDEPFSFKTHKVLFFVLICIGVFIVAIKTANQQTVTPNIQEELAKTNSYGIVKGASTSLNQAAKEFGIKSTDPQQILNLGREIIASQTGKITRDLNQKAENIASDTAKNITNFIYKNTVERVIQNLIHTLPQERQEEYIKNPTPTEVKK